MAERSVSNALLESSATEQVLAAGGISRRRRNVSNRNCERLRKPQSKSPKRRACTPEPDRKAWTDESEKDVSDVENVLKRDVNREENFQNVDRPEIIPRRARALGRTKEKEMAIRRTRSAERAPVKDSEADVEEDFETVRSMHKSKELEEEIKQTENFVAESKPKIKNEPKDYVQKEMPPLIIAPKDLRKRARHKSVPIQETLGAESALKQLPKVRSTSRKLSTSEEEEETNAANAVNKGKVSLKAKKTARDDSEPDKNLRIVKRVVKREKTDLSESEGRSSERMYEDESDAQVDEPVKEIAADTGGVSSFSISRWWPWTKKPEDTSADKAKTALTREKEEEKEKEKRKEDEEEKEKEKNKEVEEEAEEASSKKWLLTEIVQEWKVHVDSHPDECCRIMNLRNRCISQLLLVMIYCGFGGIIFRFTEGAFENFFKCGVKRVKRDFIDSLWGYSQYMLEEDWKSQARKKLMEFEEQLHNAHEAGMTTYSGQKSWSFLNSVVYCITVITTIGYGHISPSTTTGRAITIIYAIFGIPMFLILLADFGKLFTRGIKFLWAFVRRLYYTGSCKKVRRTVPVQEVMKGMQLVYDYAKNKRPTQWSPENQPQQQNQLKVPDDNVGSHPDTPGTPNLSAFEIDDEFNLPISVAIFILLIYIFFGATIYWTWEDWSFFESFYFVFISMSTIGFGDFVPQHPAYMMASIIYLVFGLALTSMCINVVQEKLSDTFRQASTKIGATIGLQIVEDGTLSAPADLADVNPMQNVNSS